MGTTKSMILMDEKTPNSSILHYIPLSRRKKGESPFVEFLKGLKIGDIEVLRESFTIPLKKIIKQEIKIDLTKANLPQRQTKDGFNPRAYKLMAKAGPYVKIGSTIDTKKESTYYASVWCRVKHIDVENYHGSSKVKRQDVTLTNPEKECLEQGEEDGGQSTVDELKEVNLGTIEKPRRASLSSEEKGKYISLLTEYRDIFSWSYKEIPGLDPKVAIHHLAIKPGYRSIKQVQRSFRPELIPQIEVEVNKLIEARLIRELRMNPLKYAFGVTSEKILGFIVKDRGIEIDQSKIDVIQKMPRPKSLHDLRSIQKRLTYIRRSLGALLTQEEEKGKECVLYYLSRTLVGVEVNYSPIKKMCLALFFVIDKLRHYMQAFTIHLVAKADPINAARTSGVGAGIVLTSPEKHMLPYSFALAELCSNNVAKYQALIIGLQMTLEIGVSFIEIYGDSNLIINLLSLQYDVKHENLKTSLMLDN
ncbi:uncharacterized protein E5676_scaffold587G00090 [Cucumis melo var. makuwa]|uniref:RNase H type-1 domain-containing protein n=1 Tax=Cucumis melo var. makuwa TaxID=1194695 RepID=A0A5D3E2I2_CUCMM|nr:uncharacterized protein E5676_scaffold587G00090 [Cucumis melo var. makuwa]